MFASITSVALVGVEPRAVKVEVRVGGHTPSFTIVGLPDTAVREAKERVKSAIVACGYRFPSSRVVVNLAPADLPKAGSAYDLPIALGVLVAAGMIPNEAQRVVALGELALDGRIRAVRGGLGAAIVARETGLRCVLPSGIEHGAQVSDVTGAAVAGAEDLASAVSAALGESRGSFDGEPPMPLTDSGPDLSAVRGQAMARRALEVAAAGGHHLLMSGPPGSGKTLLARCVQGLLPPLDTEASLEVSLAWAAAGRVLVHPSVPPFRSPHHSATLPALVGGGSGLPTPGEVSLAHRGVLFLDELGEWGPHLLDALRQPIEDGSVTIARRGASVRFPSSVQVIAATNPCPCGYFGDRTISCRCTERSRESYRRRFSGPLLDRFDLRLAVGRVDAAELVGPPGEPSAAVQQRVTAARAVQSRRGGLNRDLERRELDGLAWDPAALSLLERAISRRSLSARGWDRVRRVARTIADLDGCDAVGEPHVAEALVLRGPE